MADVGETDFAVIVFREEDQWEADALPAVVTADLDDFVQALRRQPSIGGTIGFAGVDDFFFVAVRVLGDDVVAVPLRSHRGGGLYAGPAGARGPGYPGAPG